MKLRSTNGEIRVDSSSTLAAWIAETIDREPTADAAVDDLALVVAHVEVRPGVWRTFEIRVEQIVEETALVPTDEPGVMRDSATGEQYFSSSFLTAAGGAVDEASGVVYSDADPGL